ncbi:MAG: helix-turn-helix transcriptional regulator [Agathobacter sp.]|nr:helix-turn-helix transcriptional regulator [Agathobacter sp.]
MKNNYEQQYKEIGLNIAHYRKLRGYTQIEFAEKIDVSRTHLSNIEAPRMKTSLSLDLLFKIADILDVDIRDLFVFHSK